MNVRTFPRTMNGAGGAFRDATYASPIERTKRFDWFDALCWVLTFALLGAAFSAPYWIAK